MRSRNKEKVNAKWKNSRYTKITYIYIYMCVCVCVCVYDGNLKKQIYLFYMFHIYNIYICLGVYGKMHVQCFVGLWVYTFIIKLYATQIKGKETYEYINILVLVRSIYINTYFQLSLYILDKTLCLQKW